MIKKIKFKKILMIINNKKIYLKIYKLFFQMKITILIMIIIMLTRMKITILLMIIIMLTRNNIMISSNKIVEMIKIIFSKIKTSFNNKHLINKETQSIKIIIIIIKINILKININKIIRDNILTNHNINLIKIQISRIIIHI